MKEVSRSERLLAAVASLQMIARDTCMAKKERHGLELEFRTIRIALKIDNNFCQSGEKDRGLARAALANIELFFESAATTKSGWEKISEALSNLRGLISD